MQLVYSLIQLLRHYYLIHIHAHNPISWVRKQVDLPRRTQAGSSPSRHLPDPQTSVGQIFLVQACVHTHTTTEVTREASTQLSTEPRAVLCRGA